MITTRTSRKCLFLFALTLASDTQALSLSQTITQWITDHKDVFFYAACIGYVYFSQRQIGQLKNTLREQRKQEHKTNEESLLGLQLAGAALVNKTEQQLGAKIAENALEIANLKIEIAKLKVLGIKTMGGVNRQFKEIYRIQKAQSDYVKIMLNDIKKSPRWKLRYSYNPRTNKQSQDLKNLMFQVGRQEKIIHELQERLNRLEL